MIRSVQLSCSVTHQRKTHSGFCRMSHSSLSHFSTQTHMSLFQKQTEHIMKHFTLSLVQPIPYQTWKNVQSSKEIQLSLPSKSSGSAFNHTQNQGRSQRKAADKIPFHWLSNFICPEYFPSIISLYLILLLWCMAGQVCLPLSSDEERQVPSVKPDILTGLAKSQR